METFVHGVNNPNPGVKQPAASTCFYWVMREMAFGVSPSPE